MNQTPPVLATSPADNGSTPPSTRIVITGLARRTTVSKLRRHFEQYGSIVSIRMGVNEENQCAGHAVVVMNSSAAFARAAFIRSPIVAGRRVTVRIEEPYPNVSNALPAETSSAGEPSQSHESDAVGRARIPDATRSELFTTSHAYMSAYMNYLTYAWSPFPGPCLPQVSAQRGSALREHFLEGQMMIAASNAFGNHGTTAGLNVPAGAPGVLQSFVPPPGFYDPQYANNAAFPSTGNETSADLVEVKQDCDQKPKKEVDESDK